MATTKTPQPQPAVSVAGLQVIEREPFLTSRLNLRLTREQYADLQKVASMARVPLASAARRLVVLACADLLAQQQQEAA